MIDAQDTRTEARGAEVANRLTRAPLRIIGINARVFVPRSVVDPTVTIFEGMFTARTGTLSPSYAMVADRFPPQVRRYFLSGGLPVPEGMDALYKASFAKMLELVGELHRAGVTIVAGTDGLGGFTLHRELENYVRAGLTPVEVLRIATLVPAQVLKREADLGTIEPGKLADFILVDGDPTTNISDIRRVVTVVKDGHLFDTAAIYRELGVAAAR